MMRFQVYEGSEPYVFISYSHCNEERCGQLLAQLQKRRVRFWYDFEGIHGGAHWRDILAERIENASCFVALISQDYLESANCRDEIEFALDNGKTIIQVFIEDLELMGGLAMSLNRKHRLYRSKYSSETAFINALMRSEGMEACVERTGKVQSAQVAAAGTSAEMVEQAQKRVLDAIEEEVRWKEPPRDCTTEERKVFLKSSRELSGKSVEEVWRKLSVEEKRILWAVVCREMRRREELECRLEELRQKENLDRLKRYVRREQKRIDQGEALLQLPADVERQAAEKLRQALYTQRAQWHATPEQVLEQLSAQELNILLTVAARDEKAFRESPKYIKPDRVRELVNKASKRYQRRGKLTLGSLRILVGNELKGASGPLAVGKRKMLREMLDAIDQILDYGA